MKHISKLLTCWHTVFTYKYLQDILWISNINTLKTIVKSLLKANILVSIRPWYRWLPQYNQYEFACKLRTPSYISLETVLQKHGVIFQDYSQSISLISKNSYSIQINAYTYIFRKISMAILLNPMGIEIFPHYSIASKERAICDMIYLIPHYYFDNIGTINLDFIQKLAQIYPKHTQKAIFNILSNHAQSRKT